MGARYDKNLWCTKSITTVRRHYVSNYYAPARRKGDSKRSFFFIPSVAYIANNCRTRRPSVPKRSRSPGPLMLTHIVRHIFRTTRPTNFKLVTRMEDSYLTVPGLPVPAPPVPQSAEYWPWMMAISYSISDSRPRCYGLIGSSSRIFCMNSCPSSLSN